MLWQQINFKPNRIEYEYGTNRAVFTNAAYYCGVLLFYDTPTNEKSKGS